MEVSSKYSNFTVAVIGCGAIGKRHIEVLDKMGLGKIIACDPSNERLADIKVICPRAELVNDYHDALAQKPFAVYILTPTKMHIAQAMEAIEAGAHVFIEKPLSNSSEGTEVLEKAAERLNKKVMIGFCFRYHDALLYAKKELDSGRIGRLVSIRALMGENFPSIHPEYKEMYLSKYSGAFELVHDLDLAIWYANQEVKNVFGVCGPFSDYEFESPDTVEMLVEFKEKCVATVHLDMFQTPRRRKIELIATKGVITVEFASWDSATVEIYDESAKWQSKHFDTDRNDMFFAENREFFDCIIDDNPIKCTIKEACKSLDAIEKVYKPY